MVTNVHNWPPERVDAFIATAGEFPGLEATRFQEEGVDVLTEELVLFDKVRIRGFTDEDPGNALGSFYHRWENEADPYPGYVYPGLAVALEGIKARARTEWGLPASR